MDTPFVHFAWYGISAQDNIVSIFQGFSETYLQNVIFLMKTCVDGLIPAKEDRSNGHVSRWKWMVNDFKHCQEMLCCTYSLIIWLYYTNNYNLPCRKMYMNDYHQLVDVIYDQIRWDAFHWLIRYRMYISRPETERKVRVKVRHALISSINNNTSTVKHQLKHLILTVIS